MSNAFSSGSALVEFDRLDSTSLEAKRRAAAGAVGPLWILAREQTRGYGRRGASWRSGVGDLCASFLFNPDAPVERLGELSFVAALSVAEALDAAAPGAAFRLKWPNDVLLDGRKVCGILLELVMGAPGKPPLLVFGVGVNIVTTPGAVEYPTARLLDVAPAPGPRALLEAIDAAFSRRLNEWRMQGFAPVRLEWLSRADRVGERIRVRLADETATGVLKDLDPNGALVLDCDGAERRITAGSVLRI